MKLTTCNACRRHVKVSDTGTPCPFCGSSSFAIVGEIETSVIRDRTALLFGAAAVASALAVAGCARNEDTNGGAGSGVVMPYGVPIPEDAGAGAPPILDAGTASGPASASPTGIVMPYGVPLPSPHASSSSAGPTSSLPTSMPVAPAYGAPPPTTQPMAPAYGAPAPRADPKKTP